MKKLLFFLAILLPFYCLAQFSITGRVLNQADTKPVANASVFLSNTTIGTKTANDGAFTFHNLLPGNYELIVSVVGFETTTQKVTITNGNMVLPGMLLFPKTIALNEVTIKPVTDPNRERNYNWFKNEFLGTSAFANDCKILNPEILDLDYDEQTNTLTASSADFLIIKNGALGYQVKYLLTNFSLQNKDNEEKKIYFQGHVLFEELKGKPAEQRRWESNRRQAYENSPMHFLRSALGNRLDEEGFRVQQLSIYANPDRPTEDLINKRLEYYKGLKSRNDIQRDSMAYWAKKSRLPKTFQKLMPFTLNSSDIIKATNQPGQYSLGCENDGLMVAYNKSHRFHMNGQTQYLYNASNTENTLISFVSPNAFFNANGVISNPYSVLFYGVWGRSRVADLLPVDYESPETINPPAETSAIKNIISRLDTFLAKYPIEKAYLHFDKPYYAAGDTLYFKAYVTEGEENHLSTLSGILHVDFINTQNKIDRSIKLQSDSGIAWGDFALPDSLPPGNYRVRAYTQWMRNNNNYGFFEKTIPIGSINNFPAQINTVKQPAQITAAKPDIQFFPEGGNLVTGIPNRVAFKAIGTDGLGIDVKGVVLNENNQEICTFSSTHLGMGCFYLNPKEGETYKAKLTFANGIVSETDLPAPQPSGIVLTLNNYSIAKASLKIVANGAYFRANHNKDYFLLIYSGGKTMPIGFKLDSSEKDIDISTEKLRLGIATVTLFSQTGEPLCERLFFVENQNPLNIQIKSEKQYYSKREKVKLSLNVKDNTGPATLSHFSVSVIDESKVPIDENNEHTILTDLLLTSGLKGYVEQPNYYFTDTSANARLNLDVLMLTQGYRRFEWKQVLNNTFPAITCPAEKYLEISGTVTGLSGKPVSKGKINLIPVAGGPVLSTLSDDNGKFNFNNLIFNDTARFVLNAVKANGHNSTKITYLKDDARPALLPEIQQPSPSVNDGLMDTYLKNKKNGRNIALNDGRGKGIQLKEVKIRDVKVKEEYRTESLAGAGHADQVLHSADLGYGPLISKLSALLRGVTFIQDTAYLTLNFYNSSGQKRPTKMLLIVDGVENSDAGELRTLQGTDIETVEVLKYASASIYGVNGGGGVLVITTKRGGSINPNDIASIGVLPISPVGFYKAREFYAPKYDITNNNNKHPDLRSTVYWNPEIKTDKDGNASFEYFNADGAGNYKVLVEGIDENGNLGRQVYRYGVEL